jgi:hypothetical protein
MGILVLIKNAVSRGGGLTGDVIPALIPDDMFTFRPLTFDDYVVSLSAERTCIASPYADRSDINPAVPEESLITDNKDLWISGIYGKGINWGIPFVKCDSRKCEREGQDAQPFCEYGILAISGKDEADKGGTFRAQQFRAWLYDRYPALTDAKMPFSHDFAPLFPSEQSMSDYVKRTDYGKTGYPKIVMGVVFEGNDSKIFKYTLRQNSTNYNAPEAEDRQATLTTPDTTEILASYARNDFDVCVPIDGTPELGFLGLSCTGQYMYNGVLPMQRLVNDFMFNITSAADQGYYVSEAGVAFTSFPSPSYEENGFFASIGGK